MTNEMDLKIIIMAWLFARLFCKRTKSKMVGTGSIQ